MNISPSKAKAVDRRLPGPVVNSGYKAVKRLLHFMLMLAAIVLSTTIILRYDHYQSQWLSHEASQPGKILSRQYALALAPLLENNNVDAARMMLETLRQEPVIMDAALFAADGQPWLEGDSPISLAGLYHRDNVVVPITHLAVITSQSGEDMGFLRLLINQEALLDKPLALNQQREEMFLEIAALSLLIGIYLTRTFYKTRPVLRLWLNRLQQPVNYKGNLNRRR